MISDKGSLSELLNSLENSSSYFNKIPENTIFWFGKNSYSRDDMRASLNYFRSGLQKFGLTKRFFRYVKDNFNFYSSASEEVLYTGYFEAILKGEKEKTSKFRYPVYKKPDDLVIIELNDFSFIKEKEGLPNTLIGRLTGDNKVIPFYSREEIDNNNVLSGKGLEIAWIDDPVSLFFMHIQGSGIIEFRNGEKIRVNYDGSNGHPYRAIGKYLVSKGVCTYKELSMQLIKNYIGDNPDEAEEIFNYNPSYIFFRIVEDGPVGSLGVPVTPYRTIATDRYLFPRGAICYIDTKIPDFDEKGNSIGFKHFSGFVMNQDTGGAIRSPSRADIFTGNGENSELVAGHLKEKGKLYFLVKKRFSEVITN